VHGLLKTKDNDVLVINEKGAAAKPPNKPLSPTQPLIAIKLPVHRVLIFIFIQPKFFFTVSKVKARRLAALTTLWFK